MNGADIEDMKKVDEMKKIVLRKLMSKEAIERISRLKLVKPDLAAQLELYLVQLYQTGKIGTIISDDQLKLILESLTSKKEFKIIR
jgi:programmed cell death protein 5